MLCLPAAPSAPAPCSLPAPESLVGARCIPGCFPEPDHSQAVLTAARLALTGHMTLLVAVAAPGSASRRHLESPASWQEPSALRRTTATPQTPAETSAPCKGSLSLTFKRDPPCTNTRALSVLRLHLLHGPSFPRGLGSSPGGLRWWPGLPAAPREPWEGTNRLATSSAAPGPAANRVCVQSYDLHIGSSSHADVACAHSVSAMVADPRQPGAQRHAGLRG